MGATKGGKSRAAKKRAKKKQKKSMVTTEGKKEEEEEEDAVVVDSRAKKHAVGSSSWNDKKKDPPAASPNGGVQSNGGPLKQDKPLERDNQNGQKRHRPDDDESADGDKVDDDPLHDDKHDDKHDDDPLEAKVVVPEPQSKKRKKKSAAAGPAAPLEQRPQTLPPASCKTLLDLMQQRQTKDDMAHWTTPERANAILNFLLQPAGLTAAEFYQDYWEQKPLLVQATTTKQRTQHQRRLDGLLSLNQIRDLLSQKTLCYGRDLNVTKYERDKHGQKRRVTLDVLPPTTKTSPSANNDTDDKDYDYVAADPKVVWTHYQKGCSVRLLCPHEHVDSIHALLQWLELEWGCMVGANAYLTPASQSQGFAPHYDDIEAFCLQLQGAKRWKVYAPLTKADTLPRVSSRDFSEERDLKDATPVMDVVLAPGDLLYLPRGWIHQACTLPAGGSGANDDGHSLHLTVSAMQQWSWADLMELVLPEALNAAAASETSTALRQGLPVRFLEYMGAAHSQSQVPDVLQQKMKALEKEENDNDSDDDEAKARKRQQAWQEEFRAQAKMRIMRIAKEAMDLLDASCDQISKQFLSARQPPLLRPAERSRTSAVDAQQRPMLPDTQVRLVRPGVARLVLEDEKAIVYHCLDNSRVYHGRPLSPLEFELDDGPALEQLLQTVEPQWIQVTDLFHDTIEDKVGVTQALYDEGLLMVRRPEDDQEEEAGQR